MSIRKVLHYGEPSLREKSKEVHKVSKKINDLITDLFDTMYAQNGVGLTAPQIGENLRVFVIDASTKEEPLEPMVFINPKIIKKSGAVVSQEGCLSFPNQYAKVIRPKEVTVEALDRSGKKIVIKAKDLLAQAICHECDHLEGELFIDKIVPGTLEYVEPEK